MRVIDDLLGRLSSVRRSGSSWAARCPAHEDRKASLSVGQADDGTILVKCHAGCNTSAVLSAVGLRLRDLFPTNGHAKPAPAGNGSNGQPARTYATANDAVAELERKLGPKSAFWTYTDAAGQPVGVVVRWDLPDGKTIRPVSRSGDGWRVGAMPAPRPLYRLPELTAADHIVVVEGEKCADAACKLGFAATTSAGGASAPGLTDWGPLKGKDVTILPDNDEPGERYAAEVAKLCHAAGARSIRVLRLRDHAPRLPRGGGDLADALASENWCGIGLGDAAEPRDLLTFLLHRIREAPEWRPEPELSAQAGPELAAGQGSPGSRPELVTLATVQPEPVRWLWPGRVPLGRITLLAGRPGSGKSFVTLDWAARVSLGAAWPGGSERPVGDALLICAEDDPNDTIRPRLDAAGADCRRVHLLKAAKMTGSDGREREIAFDLSNVELLRSALAQLPNCRLVVVDPVGSYLGGQVDAHRDNEVRAVLAPLTELAAERGVAVILVAHTRKAMGGFADDMPLGSRAFVGLARSVLHVVADPERLGRKLLLPGKNNLAAPAPGLAFWIAGDPPRLEWEPEPVEGVDVDALVAGAGRSPGRPARERTTAVDWLEGVLAGGPAPVREVRRQAKEAGLSWATVRRAAVTLGVAANRQGFAPAAGWVWSLPAQDAQKGNFERLGKNSAENPQDAQNSILSTFAGRVPSSNSSNQAGRGWPWTTG